MTPAIACPTCHAPVVPGAQYCSKCGHDISGPQGDVTTVQLPLTVSQRDRAQSELLDHLRQATLGEYDIVGELGRGGMATVYLAHDIALDRQVAIKVMNPGLMMGEGTRDRFKREARTAAALTHPHIIPVHLVRETDRVVFFIMKYVQGRSLDSIIFERGPLPVRMAQAILTQVGGALGYAHRRGVVHRDIKPANIMIDEEGWAVVTDFGIAKVSDASLLTKSGVTVGTPYYMSPEQCSARPVTGASDQYSLGVVGYEMLAGKTPFAGDSLMDIMRKHFFELPTPLLTLRPDCPQALATTIERMLAKEPEGRWPSIDDAIGAMAAQPLGHDDPVRTQMIELARSGIKPVARIPTPVSPVPAGKPSIPTPVAAVTAPKHHDIPVETPGRVARAGPRRRLPRPLLWGAIGAVVAGISLGIYRLAHVAPSAPTVPQASAPDSAVLVASVARIEITGAPSTLEQGQQAQLTASAKTPEGKTVESAAFLWSSGDTTVATVSKDGVVTGHAAGTATVTASSGGRSEQVGITVTAAAVATFEVTPPSAVVPVRGTATLTATPKDARGSRLAGRQITWSSSDRTVATVAQNGVVTGVGTGTTILMASCEGKSASVRITVTLVPVASLAVTPPSVSVLVGGMETLTAMARDASGRLLSGRSYEWMSSDSAIASISPGGVVKGVGPGTARVTAMTEGVRSGATIVTVVPPAPVAPGVLRMVITPWANVSIDGRTLGRRNEAVDTLPAGIAYRLRFEHDGYVTLDTTVTLRPGDVRQLRIRLTARNP